MSLNFISTIGSTNSLTYKSYNLLKTKLILLGFLLALDEFSAPAIADLSKADHAAMQQVIKQYIMDNPISVANAAMDLLNKYAFRV